MNDDILTKVRKLLAKAEDPAATPGEAETYTAKAAELIATYGIDRALLAQSDPTSDVVGDRVVLLDPPYALDKAGLLGQVALKLRCRAVHRTRYPDGVKELSVHLFGYESDLLRAELLYTSLLLQATSLLARTPTPSGENVAAFRRSWLAGFTSAISRRLTEAEDRAASRADAQAREQGSSMALVLADRSAMVDSAVADEYPRLRRGRTRALSGSGGRAGWAAGQRADLGAGPTVGAQTRGRIAG